VPFQRSAISWFAICGVFAPTAMQFDAVQQSNATTVAGKGAAARPDVTTPGRDAPAAAAAVPAASGTVIAVPAAIAPRAMVNRARDATILSSRDLSTVITIRRRNGRGPRMNAAAIAWLLSRAAASRELPAQHGNRSGKRGA
jgi:hypothetical protein